MSTLSIFTCVLGEPAVLQNTANSIRPWLSNNINWIIKFSGPANKDYVDSLSGDHIKIYQEPDTSLYDGLNQCLNKCETDYYMVLGAGDTLLHDGMAIINKRLSENTLTDSIYHAPLLLEIGNYIFTPEPNNLRATMSCPHPSSILKVKNSIAIGGFDLSYKIASDYDHLSRYSIAYGYGLVLKIPPPVSYMGGGISEVRALESYLEALLVRQRVWKTPDLRIFGDLLKYTATTISDTIAQNTR